MRRGVCSDTSANAYVNEKNPFTMLTYELTLFALTGFPVLRDGVMVMCVANNNNVHSFHALISCSLSEEEAGVRNSALLGVAAEKRAKARSADRSTPLERGANALASRDFASSCSCPSWSPTQ